MEMKFTDKSLMFIYLLICTLKPFNRWRMPSVEKVDFQIYENKTNFGEFEPPNILRISKITNTTLSLLVETMAHVMLHLRLYSINCNSWGKHDGVFRKLSKDICKQLGYEYEEF